MTRRNVAQGERVRLTMRRVQEFEASGGTRRLVYDERVPGLMLQITPAGSKTWYWRRRVNGRPQRVMIGSADAVSLDEARRISAEWNAVAARGGDPQEHKRRRRGALTVREVADHFEAWMRKREKHDDKVMYSMRLLRDELGSLPAHQFGLRRLLALQTVMARRKGWARATISSRTALIKQAVKLAVRDELLEPSVLHALQSVTGLPDLEGEVKPTEPVKPVPDEWVDAVQPFVSRQVWALIELQRLTGARPGELFCMRPVDLDTSSEIWTYTPSQHKTKHRGKQRVIYLGRRAQQIVQPFLQRPVNAFLFSPAEADREHLEARHAKRVTPLRYGNRPGTNRVGRRKRKPGKVYDAHGYRRAIARACRRAGVPEWSPYRLRHTFATRIRRDHGLEAAQVLLGHSKADVTQVYAEANHLKALAVIRLIG